MRGSKSRPPTEEHFFGCISRVLERQSGQEAIETIRDIAASSDTWGEGRKIPWLRIAQLFPCLAGCIPSTRERLQVVG